MNSGNNFQLSDPEEALTREMYAHFGLTIYLSQVFEKGIMNILTTFTYIENKGSWTQEQFNEVSDSFEKDTLGTLLKKLRKLAFFDTNTEQQITKSHELRNFLAHNYFWTNAAKSTITSGKISIIEELQNYQIIFRETDIIVSGLNNKIMKSHGFDFEKIEAEMEQMIQLETEKYKL